MQSKYDKKRLKLPIRLACNNRKLSSMCWVHSINNLIYIFLSLWSFFFIQWNFHWYFFSFSFSIGCEFFSLIKNYSNCGSREKKKPQIKCSNSRFKNFMKRDHETQSLGNYLKKINSNVNGSLSMKLARNLT